MSGGVPGEVGLEAVVVTARNCRDGERHSSRLWVRVGDLDAITLTDFAAIGCDPVFCVFPRRALVEFTVEAPAAADRFLWDWDGDGSVDQTTTSIVGHRYPDFGIYSPILTVERGSGTATLALDRPLLIQ